MPTDSIENNLTKALQGQRDAMKPLVKELTPVIQARVARVLVGQAGVTSQRSIREQVADITQEVFLAIFDENARILRSWDPKRGLSLKNFVGLVAQRQALSIMRTGKRNPFKEDPTLDTDFERLMPPEESAEGALMNRDIISKVYDSMQTRLSPLGQNLFELIVIRECSVDEVATTTSMSAAAIYAWRSRLMKWVREEARVILSDLTPQQQISVGEDTSP